MRRAIREYARSVAAIVVLIVVAIVCGAYILSQQRLQTPFQHRYSVYAEFASTAGLTPGLGQPVNVAGVRVGDIADVQLRDGLALVRLAINPGKLPHVFADAQAQLHPNTPLQDIQIDIYPGHATAGVLPAGSTIPVARTNVPIASDQLLRSLDNDSRTWFVALMASADQGTRGRSADLRGLLRTLGPTSAQVHQLAGALAARRHELSRLVHNLALLTLAAGAKDRQLAVAVDAGNATLQAFASQDTALRSAVAQLPGTLAVARSALGHTASFARQLGPTLTALQPAAVQLPGTLRALTPVLDQATPLVRFKLRPLVRSLQPLAVDLAPTTRDLVTVTPHLRSAFEVLNYVANELGYNGGGTAQGYIYWLAWMAHNTASVFSTEDAHGATARGLLLSNCTALTINGVGPALQQLLGPTPCPTGSP